MGAAKLARRIVGALAKNASPEELEELAQDYAAMCSELNKRLERCAELLDAGSEHQALQMAETSPALLDEVARLEFARIKEWRELCAREGLIQAEPLDKKTVGRLNEVYAKGIGSTSALYREYRAAMLRRNPEAARAILVRIVELDSEDQNARSELARLEGRKVPLSRTALLPIQRGSPVLRKGKLTQNGVGESPQVRRLTQPELKEEAARCLQRMREARQVGDLERVNQELEVLKGVVGGRKGVLTAEQNEERLALAEWAHEEIERRRAEAAARERDEQLKEALEELEQLTAEARDWEEGYFQQALQRAGGLREAGLEDWERLPDLAQRLEEVERKLSEGLRLAVERTKKQSRWLWAIGGIVGAVGLGIVAAYGWVLSKQTDVQVALERGAVSEAQVDLAKLEQMSWMFIGPWRIFVQRVERLRVRIDEEKARAEKTRKLLAELTQEAAREFEGNVFREVGRRFEECRELFEGLASEFRTELTASYSRVSEAWERFLQREREMSVQRMREVLEEFEEIKRSRMDFRHEPDEVEKGLETAGPLLAELADFQLPVMAGLGLPSETLQRAQRAKLHADNLADGLAALRAEQERMKMARTLADYQAALEAVAQSQFLESRVVDEARRVARRDLTEDGVAGAAVMPGNPEVWAFLKNQPNHPLHPERPTERERAVYLALRDQVDLNEIYLCLVTSEPPGRRGRERTLFSRGQPTQRESRIGDVLLGTVLVGEFYDPMLSPGSISFQFETFRFNNATPQPDHVRLLESRMSVESELLQRIGLADFVDRSTGLYQGPVLRLLDGVRSERAASALFVGHVILRLTELAAERPMEWGFSLSPSWRTMARELAAAAGSDILATDWMVPRQRELKEARLRKLFESQRDRSFLQEAEVWRNYFATIARQGFGYIGYVGLDGRVETGPGGTSAVELWGLEAVTLQPGLLFRRDRVGESWEEVRRPQPLTPLLAPGADRQQVWRETLEKLGLAPTEPSVQEMAPDFARADYGR